jgi:hypothetical protein
MRKIINSVVIILIFIALIALVYAYVIEPDRLILEKVDIRLDSGNNNQKNADGTALTLVHLSDFHFDTFGGREKEIIEIVNEINPDYVFITGDSVDDPEKIKLCSEFLLKLTKDREVKVYGVMGNWDHNAAKTREGLNELIKEFNESGVEILTNDNVKLSGDLYLIGVDDPHSGYDDITKAMQGVPENSTKILIAHSPEILDKALAENIDLILTGHTHGGQVRIPFYGALWIPSKYGTKYSSGLYTEYGNDSHVTLMYVNRGIGTTSESPAGKIRMFCPPEITEIKLNTS